MRWAVLCTPNDKFGDLQAKLLSLIIQLCLAAKCKGCLEAIQPQLMYKVYHCMCKSRNLLVPVNKSEFLFFAKITNFIFNSGIPQNFHSQITCYFGCLHYMLIRQVVIKSDHILLKSDQMYCFKLYEAVTSL